MNSGNKKRKIVVYSHDTFGLGNIRRMLAIAKALVEKDPNTSVLILSGSPMLHAFRIPPQIDYIKLPCLTRTMSGNYEAKYLDLDYRQIQKLRSNLIQSSIVDFDPDLVLVDKKPFGVGDELSGALDELRARGHRAKLVLLLRDILDSPEPTIRVWRKNGYHGAIEKFYDQVLVVGTPDIFDMRKEYQFPKASSNKVRFCGYLAREKGRMPRPELRRQLGCSDNEKLVLVTPGGGEDGFQLLVCYLNGLRLKPLNNTKTLIICGPEMIESQREHIFAAIKGRSDIIVQSFTDDMMACMEAADLVISMGGYNTVCELLTLGKRAIVVPRVNPVQEQWIRAERMAKAGLLRAMHPKEMSPDLLLTLVHEELNRVNGSRQNFSASMNGLNDVCAAIFNLMCGKQETASLAKVVSLRRNLVPNLQASSAMGVL